ncbi:MAG TPA: CDP-alcohol phosphatidyltransferase family protein, partial [Acidobacteriota bacterium]|nr:CDP-alcohol phosphatidyltransferase family protein [Acidobacteriota bacterium]
MRVDQAVILIAPEGRPGKRILGLDPLERVLLTASQAGVTDFILVGADGVDGEAILASLRRDKRFQERDIRPEYISLSGLAELGGRGRVRDRFWLMEEALVFSPEIMDRALRSCPVGKADLVVVNRRTSAGDGEYAGLALLSADALARLADALRARGTSGEFPDDVIPGSRKVAFDAGPDFCETASSREAARRAGRYLIGTARKPTDGFFSKHFNRYISTFLTGLLLKLDVTPMQISVVVLAVGLLSGWLEGRGGYRYAFLGALLFELASIIDGCDGENARLTFRGSKLGGTFDIAGDAATFIFFFLNLPIGLYRSTRNDLWLVLGAVSFLSMFLFYLQMGKYTKRTGIGNNIVAIVKDIEKSGAQPGFTGALDRLAAKIAPVYRRDYFSTWAFIF